MMCSSRARLVDPKRSGGFSSKSQESDYTTFSVVRTTHDVSSDQNTLESQCVKWRIKLPLDVLTMTIYESQWKVLKFINVTHKFAEATTFIVVWTTPGSPSEASNARFARRASSECDLNTYRRTPNHYERSVWRQKSACRSRFLSRMLLPPTRAKRKPDFSSSFVNIDSRILYFLSSSVKKVRLGTIRRIYRLLIDSLTPPHTVSFHVCFEAALISSSRQALPNLPRSGARFKKDPNEGWGPPECKSARAKPLRA